MAKRAKPPNSIMVCGHPVSLSVESCDSALGEAEQIKGHYAIRLDPNQSGSVLADTAQHEIFHIIYLLAPLKSKDGEERTVTALSTHHAGVLAMNPDYREWWFGLFS